MCLKEMSSIKWIQLLVILATCCAEEGEWSEDAEDLSKISKIYSLFDKAIFG